MSREHHHEEHEEFHGERGGHGERGRGRGGRFGGGGGPFGGFGGFGPFGGGKGGGRGSRVAKGDVRLAALAVVVDQPLHGYQIIQAIEERTDGMWKPSPGSIYPVIDGLDEEGFVSVKKEGGRRVVTISPEGQQFVADHQDEIDAVFESIADGDPDGRHEIRELIGSVIAAFMQVAQSGTERQLREAKKVMIETRRSLYRILAEDDQVEGD